MAKNTHALVDPELADTLAQFPGLDLAITPLADVRAGMAAMFPLPEAIGSDDVSFDIISVPSSGVAPAIDVHLFRPKSATGPLPLYLHIHGGGFVLGAAIMTAPASLDLAAKIGCIVASVDYRLSPEATGPEPVEDCYRALDYLTANAAQFGIDPARIAIGGESAGGGLSAALALMVRDRGEHKLCLQMLIYPMLDDRTGDDHPFCGEFVWTAPTNRIAWDTRIGQFPIEGDTTGYVAPARAADLTGLAPAFISVGALDLFLEEDMEYARRLMRAGVPVECHVYPGAYHGFELTAQADVTHRAIADRYAALTRAFG